MRYEQFLILEASPVCNYASRHPECPANEGRARFPVIGKRHLDEDSMVSFAVKFYRDFGFRGLVGFHYYNEPLLSKTLLYAVMDRVLADVPSARFVLWTNGSTIRPSDAAGIARFSRIHITNYNHTNYSFLAAYCGDNLHVSEPHMDERRTATGHRRRERCVRPYTELIIDYWGNAHICCMDWRGAASPGNVFRDDLCQVVNRFRDIRAKVAGRVMTEDAPDACLNCWRRFGSIDDFDPAIAKAARLHSERLRIVRARPKPTTTQQAPAVPSDAAEYRSWVGPGTDWQSARVETGTAPYGPAPECHLYAMISTWHEGDIIEATVKNAFAQGCEKVFIVDNDSPDDTRERAVAAGAIVHTVYATDYYQDSVRIRKMNDAMREITEAEKFPRLWWLCTDADELLSGRDGQTVREYIARLPDPYNCVGAIAFDYYPNLATANRKGYHPAQCQRYGMLRLATHCKQNHWKHPLFLTYGGVYSVGMYRGLHTQIATKQHPALVEPRHGLVLHHFMYRNREATTQRLTALCGATTALAGKHRSQPDDTFLGGEGAIKRFRSLAAVYEGRWSDVELSHSQGRHRKTGVVLVPAVAALRDHAPHLVKWYDELECSAPAPPPKVAAVVCSYKIPESRLLAHFEWNGEEYRASGVDVHVCVDREYAGLPDYVTQHVYPWPMPVYSPARATNFVLRAACDTEAYRVIVRTDIDIAFGGELSGLIHGALIGRAVVPVHFMVQSFARRGEPAYCSYRGEGTIAMTTDKWLRTRGYNEDLVGYGGDDGEMVERLYALDIPVWKWHRVFHIAHQENTPQIDAVTPDVNGQARFDYWNTPTHRLQPNIPGILVTPQRSRWHDSRWGHIEHTEEVAQ